MEIIFYENINMPPDQLVKRTYLVAEMHTITFFNVNVQFGRSVCAYLCTLLVQVNNSQGWVDRRKMHPCSEKGV